MSERRGPREAGAHVPTFSICIPVYNRAKLIGRAIQSVLDQTYQDFEIIVVDDRSTDRTVEVVRAFEDPRVRLFQNESNLGIAGNCNRCFELVRGRYAGLLYSDDHYLPRMLTSGLTAFETHDVGVFAAGAIFMREDGSERNRRHPLRLGVLEPDVYFRSLYDLVYCSPPSETLFESHHLGVLGGFDARVRYIPELDFFLKIAARGGRAFHSDEMLCVRLAWDGAATSQDEVWLQLARDEFRILKRFEASPWVTRRFAHDAIMTANTHGIRGVQHLLGGRRYGLFCRLLAILMGWNLRLRPMRGGYNLLVLGFLRGPVSALASVYAALRIRWSRRVVVFGTGSGGRHVFESIRPSDKVVAFGDNDPDRWDTTFCGRPVWSLDRIRRGDFDLVVVASQAGREIVTQLVRAGLPASKVTRARGNRLWGTRFLSPVRERFLLALKRRVVIFGCGVAGRRAYEYYGQSKEVVAFADNDPVKQHTEFCGRSVWPPTALVERSYDLVLLASQQRVSIWHRLVALGVPPRKIVRVDNRILEGLM